MAIRNAFTKMKHRLSPLRGKADNLSESSTPFIRDPNSGPPTIPEPVPILNGWCGSLTLQMLKCAGDGLGPTSPTSSESTVKADTTIESDAPSHIPISDHLESGTAVKTGTTGESETTTKSNTASRTTISGQLQAENPTSTTKPYSEIRKTGDSKSLKRSDDSQHPVRSLQSLKASIKKLSSKNFRGSSKVGHDTFVAAEKPISSKRERKEQVSKNLGKRPDCPLSIEEQSHGSHRSKSKRISKFNHEQTANGSVSFVRVTPSPEKGRTAKPVAKAEPATIAKHITQASSIITPNPITIVNSPSEVNPWTAPSEGEAVDGEKKMPGPTQTANLSHETRRHDNPMETDDERVILDSPTAETRSSLPRSPGISFTVPSNFGSKIKTIDSKILAPLNKSDDPVGLACLQNPGCVQNESVSRVSSNSADSDGSLYSVSIFEQRASEITMTLGAVEFDKIERLRAGTSNHVLKMKIRVNDEADSDIMGLCRIPRCTSIEEKYNPDTGLVYNDKEILDLVAVSKMLSKTNILAPKMLAFDATMINPIESPFTFQELAIGERLDFHYADLKVGQKLQLAKQVADILASFHDVRFYGAGKIVNRTPNSLPLRQAFGTSQTIVDGGDADFEIEGFGAWGFRGLGQFGRLECSQPWGGREKFIKPARSALGILKNMLAYWIEVEHTYPYPQLNVAFMHRLQNVLHQMELLHFFDDESVSAFSAASGEDRPCILHHSDFAARNIIVSPGSSSSALDESNIKATITSVVDWDDTYSIPPILTLMPPAWLWGGQGNEESVSTDYYGDYDLAPSDRYSESNTWMSREQRQVKEMFEISFVEKLSVKYPSFDMTQYQKDTYVQGRWTRRLFRFVRGRMDNDEFRVQCNRFMEDWNLFYEGEMRKKYSGSCVFGTQ